jgi:hypothetical protein
MYQYIYIFELRISLVEIGQKKIVTKHSNYDNFLMYVYYIREQQEKQK